MGSEEARVTDRTIRIVVVILAPVTFVLSGMAWIYLVYGGTHRPPLWISLSFFLLFPGLSALAFGCALAARKLPLRRAISPMLVRLPIYGFLAVLAVAVVLRSEYVFGISYILISYIFRSFGF